MLVTLWGQRVWMTAILRQSFFSTFFRTNQPRKKGGLGKMQIPLLSDITKEISKDYGVLLEDQGVALR